MKAYIFPLLAILLLFSNCKTDDPVSQCIDVNCFNGGLCNDGVCVCPQGFYGEYCELSISGPCDTLVCQNGGFCQDGWCYDCSGCFEGQFCEISSRLKFIKNFNGFLESFSQGFPINFVYNISITEHLDNECRVIISDNLNNSFYGLATANSSNLTVPQQNFTYNGDAGTITGSFNIDNQNGQQLFGNLSFTNPSTGSEIYFNYEGLSE